MMDETFVPFLDIRFNLKSGSQHKNIRNQSKIYLGRTVQNKRNRKVGRAEGVWIFLVVATGYLMDRYGRTVRNPPGGYSHTNLTGVLVGCFEGEP